MGKASNEWINMNSKDIENSVRKIFDNFSKDEFIYDLLMAYGISKTSVTRLKKGDFNLSNEPGEVLYKKKVFFKVEKHDMLLGRIDSCSKDDSILKHSPRFIIVTDYNTLVAKDIKTKRTLDIAIEELPKHFDFFLPLAGSEVYNTKNDNKADRDAAYKMAELYDNLISANPNIYNSKESVHGLNIFLSRLLFCFFAEDTGIFKDEGVFTNTLVQHTSDNGSDTHIFLNDLFKRLNTQKTDNLPAYLAQQFPYVNGGLFRDDIDSPKFTTKARKALIELGELQWQDINPDIFGSMIQAVVLPEYRSDLGMHYTSVENILKLIRPLFLDELYEEFENNNDSIPQLRKLALRMSKMKFFDPACGSGNFLIITYKEIRLLEIKILQRITDLTTHPQIEFTQIHLSQFYGIELDDFAHEMARLSLWLAEHQMNNIFEEQLPGFGQSKPILPLKEAGHIVQGNATRLNWIEVCPIAQNDEVYVMGNPPYYGSRKQNDVQKSDLEFVFHHGYKSLDYIAAWFYKGAKYITDYNAKCAFVSTNSICQGNLVALTWPRILNDKIEIGFAYHSFKWKNNAKDNAGVTVVIIGLRNKSNVAKYIYKDGFRTEVKVINSYLEDRLNIVVPGRNTPLSKFPEMNFGNMPADNGNLLLNEAEKRDLLLNDPECEKWIRPFISASEFLNGGTRFCIWLEGVSEEEYTRYNPIRQKIEDNYITRLNSSRPKLAQIPHLFAQITQPTGVDFILIPRHSSENRDYIPIGYFDSLHKAGDSNLIVATNEAWLFGLLHSRMHMTWVKAVGGRLKTDYRYSASLCYNTFPFPDISTKQKETLKQYVLAILDERAKHPEKTMAQLYDPETMPVGLRQAHKELDEAIERCYRLQPFANDTERLEYLFKLYEEMIAQNTLFAKQKKTRTKK